MMSGYASTTWVDGQAPALSAANLNKIEAGLVAALGYDTAQALRDAGVPTSVQTAMTRGALACGDGGGQWWRWDAASTAADDLGSVLLPAGHSGAGRWVTMMVGPVDPRCWGAVPLGAGDPDDGDDSTAAIQAAIDYAAAIRVATVSADRQFVGVEVDLGGRAYGVTDTLILADVPNAKGIQLRHGALFAIGATWTTDQFMVDVQSLQAVVSNLALMCRHLASGITDSGGDTTIKDCEIVRHGDYGIYLNNVASGGAVDGCNIFQWGNAESNDPDDYDGTGIHCANGDVNITNCIVYWSGVPIRIGVGGGTCMIRGCHLFNGNSPGNTANIAGITMANPIVIETDGAHNLTAGWDIFLGETIVGADEIEKGWYTVGTVSDATHFVLCNEAGTPIDGTGYTPWTSGGTVKGNGFSNTKNLIVDKGVGSVVVDNCYIDNGQIDIYNSNTTLVGCSYLATPEKAANKVMVTKYASSVDDYEVTSVFSGVTNFSRLITAGKVSLLAYADFGAYNWKYDFSALPGLFEYYGTGWLQQNETVILSGGLSATENTASVVVFSPHSATYGTRMEFVDATTTIGDGANPPHIRCSGDGLVLQAEQIRLRLPSGGVGIELEAATGDWQPLDDNAQNLGGSDYRWEQGFITTVRYGDGTAKLTSYAGSPETHVGGVPGSVCSDLTNGDLYVKKTGTGTTGWKKVTLEA